LIGTYNTAAIAQMIRLKRLRISRLSLTSWMLRSPLVWPTASLDQIAIEMSAESPDTQNQEHDASADLQHLEKQPAAGSRQYRCHGPKPVAVGNKSS
jgi:hypothetical protein